MSLISLHYIRDARTGFGSIFPEHYRLSHQHEVKCTQKKIVQAERSKFDYVLAGQTVIYIQKVSTCFFQNREF